MLSPLLWPNNHMEWAFLKAVCGVKGQERECVLACVFVYRFCYLSLRRGQEWDSSHRCTVAQLRLMSTRLETLIKRMHAQLPGALRKLKADFIAQEAARKSHKQVACIYLVAGRIISSSAEQISHWGTIPLRSLLAVCRALSAAALRKCW